MDQSSYFVHGNDRPRVQGTKGVPALAVPSHVAAMFALLTGATLAHGADTIVVDSVAVVGWMELVNRDRVFGAANRTHASFKPFIAEPPPRYIGEGVGIGLSGELGARTGPNDGYTFSEAGQIQTIENREFRAFGSSSFAALPDDGTLIPPDTNGAVGPDHVMTMLNTSVRIQNRSGQTVAPDVSLPGFWSPLVPQSVADPRLVYDASVGRWYAVAIANFLSADSAVFLAVSLTSDPTDAWAFYEIDADPANQLWADFPDVGYSSKWLALTANMETIGGNDFSGVAMWVIDKSEVLSGGSVEVTRFPAGFDMIGGGEAFSLRPCRSFDVEPTLYLVDNSGLKDPLDDTQLIRLSQVKEGVDGLPIWSVVPGSQFSGSGLFRVPTNFHYGQIDAPQLGSETRVETNGPRMLNAVYRNGHVWCTHTAGMPESGSVTRTAVFWYQVDPLAMPSPVVQAGIIDGGAEAHYFFPSIAVNAADDVAIGFSRSDPTRFVEAVATGRRAGDPPGIMAPIMVVKKGEQVYEKDFKSLRVRWGDYSSTEVDPLDDLTFWTIQEYASEAVGPNETDQRWGTWWAAVEDFQRIGACCSDGGVCLGDLDYAWCAEAGGALIPDAECLDSPCPVLATACENAAELACNTSVTFENLGISNPASPPYGCAAGTSFDGTVWFSFTATETSARLTTCNSIAQDSTLAVYDGACEGLAEIGCSEDDCGLKGFLSDLLVEDLTPGKTYRVQMSAFLPNDRGTYTLQLACPACRDVASLEPDPFTLDTGNGSKSRYISFLEVNADRRVAIRLTFVDMPPGYEEFEGDSMWIGPSQELTESPGDLFPFQAPGAETFRRSTLQCTPAFREWSRLGVVHVAHRLLVPDAVVVLQAIDDGCPTDIEENFSTALLIATSRWGDIVKDCSITPCGSPDGRIDVPTDVLAVVNKFVAKPGAPIKARADLGPETPDHLIDITDVLYAIQGFVGLPYPFQPPTPPCAG